ncbi:MAG: hypothetical protein K2X93_17595 [Candidatus Obscuribacterales bacterium]|nr:hypothetical protein [Candidatus Obscuribacterales bacterium]
MTDANDATTDNKELYETDSGADSGAQRRVAPTLIETDIKRKTRLTEHILATLNKTRDHLTKPNTKIARTLLEGVSDSPDGQARISHEEKFGGKPKNEVFVAKTMLDYDLIQQALGGAIEKTAGIFPEKPEKDPGLQTVKGFKPATACPSKAVCVGKQRIDYCGTCGIEMYNLDGLDADEARRLIFTRENREDFPLFMRHDGLFMTRDCPQVKEKSRKKVLMLLVLVLVVVSSITLFTLMPPPPKPATAPEAVESTTPTENTVEDSDDRKARLEAESRTEVGKSGGVAPAQLQDSKSKDQQQYYYELPAAPARQDPPPQSGESSTQQGQGQNQQPIGY